MSDPQQVRVRYVGQHPELIVHQVGAWARDEVKAVDAGLAARLLRLADFVKDVPRKSKTARTTSRDDSPGGM